MNPFESSDIARFHELDAEYEILGELGRGGTSVVYRARERELGRDVAIKVVRSSHVHDQEAVARLAREAKLVAALRHPNIVPLLSVRHLSDGLALIMQHVPGRTLKRAVRDQGRLPVAMVEHVLREIGSALDYAHKKHGIVHRDIKPENIYLDEEVGRALLSDFGIARTAESDSTLTLVGTALGTPAYMSPEQIDGTALDGRSDLYSLGLVAHEMLTGQQPWVGHNLYTIIYKQKHEDLPPISELRQDVPLYLLNAVHSLLRKDVAERCPDAAHFLAQLQAPATTIDFAAPPAREEAEPPAVGDDSPTLRFQRPQLVVDEPPAPPVVPEPVILEPPAEVAIAATAAAVPVLELPTVRPNWRRAPSARGRGGLAPGGVFAQPEVAAVQATTHDDDDDAAVAATQPRRKLRLVAGITLFLMLGASATVVAMINGRKDAPENPLAGTPAHTPAQPRENAEAALLNASAAAPPVLSAAEPSPRSAEAAPEATRQSSEKSSSDQRTEDLDTQLQVPNVALPSLAVGGSVGQLVSPADFSSAGVMPKLPEERVSNTPTFAPRTVEPHLKNRAVVQRALVENYPPMLRERGVSGTVSLWVLVDSTGKVQRSEIHQSSGNVVLDRAAARVVDVMQFTPAMNRDRHVSVWIQLPIQFKAQAN